MHAIWQWGDCTAWDARTACRLQRVSAAAVGPLLTQQRFAVLPAAWVRCSSSVRGCSMLTLDCGPPSITKNHLCVKWLVDSLSGVQPCSTLNTVSFFLPSVLLCRPDYLDRCQPEVSAAGAGPIPFGTYPTITCTTADLKELRDGHFSFPSGHASCSMVIGLFGALYVLWAVHCRGNR